MWTPKSELSGCPGSGKARTLPLVLLRIPQKIKQSLCQKRALQRQSFLTGRWRRENPKFPQHWAKQQAFWAIPIWRDSSQSNNSTFPRNIKGPHLLESETGPWAPKVGKIDSGDETSFPPDFNRSLSPSAEIIYRAQTERWKVELGANCERARPVSIGRWNPL